MSSGKELEETKKETDEKKEEDFSMEMAKLLEKQTQLIPSLQRFFYPRSQEIRFGLNHMMMTGELKKMNVLGSEAMDLRSFLTNWWSNSWLGRSSTFETDYFKTGRKSIIVNHDYGEVVDAIKKGLEVEGTRKEWWITDRPFNLGVISRSCISVGEKRTVSPVIKVDENPLPGSSTIRVIDGAGNVFAVEVELVQKHLTVAINNRTTCFPSHFEGVCECDHKREENVDVCFMPLRPSKRFPELRLSEDKDPNQKAAKKGRNDVVRIPIYSRERKEPVA